MFGAYMNISSQIDVYKNMITLNLNKISGRARALLIPTALTVAFTGLHSPFLSLSLFLHIY